MPDDSSLDLGQLLEAVGQPELTLPHVDQVTTRVNEKFPRDIEHSRLSSIHWPIYLFDPGTS